MRVVLLFVLLTSSLFAQKSSLLWEITKPGIKDTSYLFGTIHLPVKELFHVNDSLPAVLEKVDAGYFEIIFDEEEVRAIAPLMMARPEETIEKTLSKTEFKEVKKYIRKNHFVHSLLLKKVKPMALTSVVISDLIPKDTTNAMDILFQELLVANGKKVYGLETMREQAELLFSSPAEIQAKELYESIHNIDSVREVLNVMVDYYKQQDLLLLDSLVNIESDAASISMIDLNYKRNIKMIPKMDKALQKESILIAIGAAHLGGDQGIIHLLEEKGYILKPIK